jgi:hypothetical protein
MCSCCLCIQCAIYRQSWEGVCQSVCLLVMLHLRICVACRRNVVLRDPDLVVGEI